VRQREGADAANDSVFDQHLQRLSTSSREAGKAGA